jgi:hypothetical protein
MLSGVVGAVFLSGSAHAQDRSPSTPVATSPDRTTLPAVDGFNWNADALAGSLAHMGIVGGRAAFTMPLAQRYGFQLDLQGGSLDGDGYGSAAGHLFWRDPNVGLLGFYGSYTRWNRYGGVSATQLSGEFEAYWGRWTLQGIAGVEFGNQAGVSTSITDKSAIAVPGPGVLTTTRTTDSFVGYDVQTRFFDQINLRYFVTDNWDVYVGHRYLGGLHALALGTELSLQLPGRVMSSLFVEGRVGEQNFEGVWGGLKFYFGKSEKSRIRRHREDDPNQWDTLFSIVNSQTGSQTSSSSRSLFCPFGYSSPGSCETGF